MATPTKPTTKHVSVEQLAKSLAGKGVEIKSARDPERIAQAREALKSSPIPDNSSHLASTDDIDHTWAELDVVDIDPYDGNPRRVTNEQYDHLKESIRVNLIFSTLSVTRRPGSKRYMMYSGGNTRLAIMKELWLETGNPKYKSLKVVVRKWPGEAMVLLAHLAENNARSDMTFWDNAQGMQTLKEKFELENQKQFSLREFNELLVSKGYKTNIASLSSFNFAIQYLSPIGDRIGARQGRKIPPRVTLYHKIVQVWKDQSGDVQEEFMLEFFKPTIEKFAQHLSDDASQNPGEENANIETEKLFEFIEQELAAYIEIEYSKLRKIVGYNEQYKSLTKSDIEKLIADKAPAAQKQIAPVVIESGEPLGSGQDEVNQNSNEQAHSTPETSKNTLKIEAETELKSIISPKDEPIVTPTENNASESTSGKSRQEEMLEDVHELLGHFNLENLIVISPRMPNGFYIGIPDQPIIGKPSAREAAIAWSLAAHLTGQFDTQKCVEMLNHDDPWRNLCQRDIDSMGFEIELALEHMIGNIETLPIGWIVGASKHPFMNIFMKIVFKYSPMSW